jgi:hypothetical protein
MAPTTKTTPKAKADKTICRWGHGRYHSPATAKDCTSPKHPGRELCDTHEAEMRKAVKAARAKAEPKPMAPAEVAPPAKVTPIRKPAPRPESKAHPRAKAAMVAVTPTITKAEQDAERRGDRGN